MLSWQTPLDPSAPRWQLDACVLAHWKEMATREAQRLLRLSEIAAHEEVEVTSPHKRGGQHGLDEASAGPASTRLTSHEIEKALHILSPLIRSTIMCFPRTSTTHPHVRAILDPPPQNPTFTCSPCHLAHLLPTLTCNPCRLPRLSSTLTCFQNFRPQLSHSLACFFSYFSP